MTSLGDVRAEMADDLRRALFSDAPYLEYVARKNPIAAVIRAFDEEGGGFLGYRFLPAPVKNAAMCIQREFGREALSQYLLLLLAELAELFDLRFAKSGLTDTFRAEFERTFARMLVLPENHAALLAINLGNDLFLKDLGIARQILVPCASHVIYRYSGIPRRVFFPPMGGGRFQLLKTLMVDTHGFHPYLENHVHLSMLGEFNEKGRERCLRLVGELLRCWPDSRGLIGTSWYYDPAVGAVSPQLAYLHDVPAAGGACFVDMGETPAARDGALVRSPTRRRLAEAGEYLPRNFMMVWSRRKLLESYPAV